MKNIHSKEREGFNQYKAAACQLKYSSMIHTCPRNPSRLIDLYTSGRVVYDRFHAFISKVAKASPTAYVYKTHDKQPGMKVPPPPPIHPAVLSSSQPASQPTFHPPIHLFIHLFIHPTIHPSMYSSIQPLTHPSAPPIGP